MSMIDEGQFRNADEAFRNLLPLGSEEALKEFRDTINSPPTPNYPYPIKQTAEQEIQTDLTEQ
jgi:hypothetical protein